MNDAMKGIRFGIEIETVGISRALLAQAIQTVVGGTVRSAYAAEEVHDAQGRTWRVVRDGSLSGGELSGEIVSPILTYSDIETLQNVIRAARKAGAKSDPSTGIHIHLDGSVFTPKGVTNLVKMIHKQERLIEHALGVSSARLNRYCRLLDAGFVQRLETERPRTIDGINRAWYGALNASPSRYHESRYHGLNLNSLFFRGTIEFRYCCFLSNAR